MTTFTTQQETSADEVLRRRLIAFLYSRGYVEKAIRVSVHLGIVYLSGRLASAQQRWAIEAACRRVAGVLDVRLDRLTVDALPNPAPAAVPRSPEWHGRAYEAFPALLGPHAPSPSSAKEASHVL